MRRPVSFRPRKTRFFCSDLGGGRKSGKRVPLVQTFHCQSGSPTLCDHVSLRLTARCTTIIVSGWIGRLDLAPVCLELTIAPLFTAFFTVYDIVVSAPLPPFFSLSSFSVTFFSSLFSDSLVTLERPTGMLRVSVTKLTKLTGRLGSNKSCFLKESRFQKIMTVYLSLANEKKKKYWSLHICAIVCILY